MIDLDGLRARLGTDFVVTEPAELDAFAYDWSARALLDRRAGAAVPRPLCVARPATTQQVSDLLAWAQETATPVVPFGGGSGVCGGIAPEGAIVVDMGRMRAIGELDERSGLVKVQAGTLGPELDGYLKERGFMLGHEPQSLQISTVGGWIATRACGQLSARYGGIDGLIAGLEAVLPGGRIVSSKTAPRRATGPDVLSLLVGSEGTLGIVTSAVLRVLRIPAERSDHCARFEHMADGVTACRKLAQSELRPTLVRLYDADDTAILLRAFGDTPAGPLLLLSFEGRDASARAKAAAEMCGGEAADAAYTEHWWAHRNDAVGEYRRLMAGDGILGPHALVETMEVSASWSGLRDLYHSMKDTLREVANIAACHLSHVYPDGACLYFTLASACTSDDDAGSTLARWWDAGMSACLAAGGSISHHHGIGRTKAPWLRAELGEAWEVLASVKKALDPKGIMNPGALGL